MTPPTLEQGLSDPDGATVTDAELDGLLLRIGVDHDGEAVLTTDELCRVVAAARRCATAEAELEAARGWMLTINEAMAAEGKRADENFASYTRVREKYSAEVIEVLDLRSKLAKVREELRVVSGERDRLKIALASALDDIDCLTGETKS